MKRKSCKQSWGKMRNLIGDIIFIIGLLWLLVGMPLFYFTALRNGMGFFDGGMLLILFLIICGIISLYKLSINLK